MTSNINQKKGKSPINQHNFHVLFLFHSPIYQLIRDNLHQKNCVHQRNHVLFLLFRKGIDPSTNFTSSPFKIFHFLSCCGCLSTKGAKKDLKSVILQDFFVGPRTTFLKAITKDLILIIGLEFCLGYIFPSVSTCFLNN